MATFFNGLLAQVSPVPKAFSGPSRGITATVEADTDVVFLDFSQLGSEGEIMQVISVDDAKAFRDGLSAAITAAGGKGPGKRP